MNYTAALSDFFKSPRWPNNLLFGGLCMLIPIVGPVVLMGWHVTGFWARKDAGNMETYPAFDFANFAKYLQRGAWPFLASMVPALAVVPLMMITMVFLFGSIIANAQTHQQGGQIAQHFPVVPVMIFGLLWMAVSLVITFLIHPLRIVASLTQDFVPIFNWLRLKRFISLTWSEVIVSMLFVWVIGFVLAVAGMLAFLIGMYFTISIAQFINAHLDAQLYQLYLARGGEVIPPSPKLRDGPPPLPPVLS